jgi:hypothetical protein
MKTEIGGGRLGSGNKMQTSFKNYSRSTHDLSSTWRSSMAAGTLVPFMSIPALPGDTFDIDLAADMVSQPTVGPLFGSFKMQLDVFQIPIRIYNAMLHMNRTGVGNDMSSVLLPQKHINAIPNENVEERLADNAQINPSSLVKYLGISGIGNNTDNTIQFRSFNAIPYLGYFDIYKIFFANKQEERGFVIHTDNDTIGQGQEITAAAFYPAGISYGGNALDTEINVVGGTIDARLEIAFPAGAEEVDPSNLNILIDAASVALDSEYGTITWDESIPTIPRLICEDPSTTGNYTIEVEPQFGEPIEGWNLQPKLQEFPLSNIDDMRMSILQHTPQTTEFILNSSSIEPYSNENKYTGTNDNFRKFSVRYPQENLALKTYQSDLFNNWINTEWLDGTNGVNEVTAVDTSGGSFTIDALNLSKKVYIMLNRVAISGGTYDDWLDAVYEHERPKSMEEPLYHGSLIKEIAFEEVISNAATSIDGNTQPLGELGGRGRLTNKNKGGKIKMKVHEPSYIMGIVSITPRIEYSQGNTWDVNFKTMNDFHKPALDAIGFQELITEQMAWQDTTLATSDTPVFKSVGKQPAWINWMTDIDRSYGNFAVGESDDYMVLNRNYTIGSNGIEDLTTYIDPVKSNYIFAQIDRSAMNFKVHIGKKITARRKMSAKVIPNL